MIWLFKILTNKNLVNSERKVRLRYIEDNNFLIAEIKKLDIVKRSLTKSQVQGNHFLKAIYNTDLNQIIFSLEILNKTTNFLWVSRKKVEQLREYSVKVKATLKYMIHLSELNPTDNFIAKKDTRSIFSSIKPEIDLSKFDFGFDNFKTAV